MYQRRTLELKSLDERNLPNASPQAAFAPDQLTGRSGMFRLLSAEQARDPAESGDGPRFDINASDFNVELGHPTTLDAQELLNDEAVLRFEHLPPGVQASYELQGRQTTVTLKQGTDMLYVGSAKRITLRYDKQTIVLSVRELLGRGRRAITQLDDTERAELLHEIAEFIEPKEEDTGPEVEPAEKHVPHVHVHSHTHSHADHAGHEHHHHEEEGAEEGKTADEIEFERLEEFLKLCDDPKEFARWKQRTGITDEDVAHIREHAESLREKIARHKALHPQEGQHKPEAAPQKKEDGQEPRHKKNADEGETDDVDAELADTPPRVVTGSSERKAEPLNVRLKIAGLFALGATAFAWNSNAADKRPKYALKA